MKIKIFAVASLFFLFIPRYSFANPADTTILGVNIEFSYSTSIFPEDWKTPAINARGEEIAPDEISRTKLIIIKALNKYPHDMLELNLKSIYFLKTMKFYDVGFGGTNSTDAVYVTNNGTSMGYTDSYIEQTFHHEFSSILFRNYPALLDTTSWKQANGQGFDYNDPEGGVGAIRNNKSSQELDSILCRNGFLTEYALSNLENDVNTLAQNLFRPAPGFWSKVNSYPRIRKKVSLLIDFYHSLNAIFTEQYFKKFDT